MHPNIISDHPGICPECGMRLVPAKDKKIYPCQRQTTNKHAGHSANAFLTKFWVSLALSAPILQPALAAVLMSLSTVLVAGNTVLLRQKKL